MNIILMRHGKPVLTETAWVSPAGMARWIAHYDESIVETCDIPAASKQAAQAASMIVASPSARALASVEALGLCAAVTDAVFAEAQLPFALWSYPRLSPFAWAAVFRILWLCGYARGADPICLVRARARQAADRLSLLAAENDVLLMGHGVMNRLIAKELRRSGWRGMGKHEERYWSANVFTCVAVINYP